MKGNASLARISQAYFGKANGVLGLHIRLSFSTTEFADYSIVELSEIEELLDAFGVSSVQDLLDKSLRCRVYQNATQDAGSEGERR